jgi:hypothetical protein
VPATKLGLGRLYKTIRITENKIERKNAKREILMRAWLHMYIYRHIIGKVTRLGKFSPIERLITLDSFMKIAEVAQSCPNIWATFFLW